MDRALDGEPGAEVDRHRRPACDALQEFMGFDNLQVVEAHLMAGSDEEALVGRMRRCHQHLTEPLVLDRSIGEVDADFVETLLIERNGAARAEYLELQSSFAAPNAAAYMDSARRAVLHAQQRCRDVESLDRPPPAAVWSVGVRLAHLAKDFAGVPSKIESRLRG